MRRSKLSLTVAALVALTLTSPTPAAAEPRPRAEGSNWPYSILPGFDPLKPASDPVALPSEPRKLNVTYSYRGRTRSLKSYLRRTAQGFAVLDGDTIVKEWYALGYSRDSLFQSWSMAKSFTSDAVGIALSEGKIKSLADTVDTYVPQLADADYGKVTLRNLLRMSSGIEWNEPVDDVPLHVSASMGTQSTLEMAAARKKGWEAGSRFNYTSMNSAVLALVVQEATGMPFYKYVQKKIWKPAGMASTAYVGNDSNGNGLGYCCFYATVRDFSRFGMMMLNGGVTDGRRVVPASWVAKATAPSTVNPQYGLHWWIDPGEGFYAGGLGDQKIYVSTKHNVVIVRSTFLNPDDGETLVALRAVAAEVARTRDPSSENLF